MLRVVPVIGLSGYVALQAFAGGSSAVSPEADSARRAVEKVVISAERSEALFGRRAIALAQLRDTVAEHSQFGWDGADANPVDQIAVGRTTSFIRMIPDYFPLPEFSPDPDGAISLDWVSSRGRFLSISIGSEDRLAFAWLDGAERGHGTALFVGKQIPRRVVYELEQIAEEDAAVRAA
jgi:hypothetical protein